MGRCKAGEKVVDLCEYADKQLLEQTANVFKKEKGLKKGTHCKNNNNFICLSEVKLRSVVSTGSIATQ